MHRGGRKFKLLSAGSGFKGQIFTGELSGVDSAGALRQGVLRTCCGNVTFNWWQESEKSLSIEKHKKPKFSVIQ